MGQRSCSPTAKPTPPSVFPLSSCSASGGVACLVTSFFPDHVTVTWDQLPAGVTPFTAPPTRLPSGLYALSSHVTTSGSTPLRCTVQHPATGVTRVTEVTAAQAATPPSLTLFHACEGDSAQLLCLASAFAPPTLSLEWLVDGRPLGPTQLTAASGQSATISLSVPAGDWRDRSYGCRVTHPATGTVKDVVGRKCLSDPSDVSAVRLFVESPSPAALYVSQDPTLRCLATSLPSDAELQITWSRKGGGALVPRPLQLLPQLNGTFTALSEVLVTPRDWLAGDVFTCTLRHRDLPYHLTKSLSHGTGPLLAPSVHVMSSSDSDTVTLTCLVQGFYPEDVSVQWMKNQEALAADAYATGQPQKAKAGDSSYFLYSRLAISRGAWQGNTYHCMVAHEALPMKFIQKRVPKEPELLLPPDFCAPDPELPAGPWDTVAIFITLFLISLCYGATITLFKVKWLLATIIQLKQRPTPAYKNVIRRVA